MTCKLVMVNPYVYDCITKMDTKNIVRVSGQMVS